MSSSFEVPLGAKISFALTADTCGDRVDGEWNSPLKRTHRPFWRAFFL
jgi:hypothetical protein